MAAAWHAAGVRLRLVTLDNIEPGIDDFDMELIAKLENTPLSGRIVAVFYHVPSQRWLNVKLPKGSLRIMITTFDGILHGARPPTDWINVCRHMDLVCVAENEISGWSAAGVNSSKLRPIKIPHVWFNNSTIPSVSSLGDDGSFRFLTVAMFQPRRRWDTLFEAFLQEFANEPGAELYVKVNYPSWHPVPDQPKRDLYDMLERLERENPSKAKIRIDDDLGARLDICRLIDGSNYYVSTDTALTAPVGEALIRGKRVIVTKSVSEELLNMDAAVIPVSEDASHCVDIGPEIVSYQPHHKGGSLQLLHVKDVRMGLRRAWEERATSLRPWNGWSEWLEQASSTTQLDQFTSYVADAIEEKKLDRRLQVRWEGSQFVYHSLALVNRELALGLLASGEINLSIEPYEVDQFDPAKDMPTALPLVDCVRKPLDTTAVHIRHQWPPNFNPPEEGAWVMIQPWEFGGIPLEWVEHMRDRVDEIWVPSSWVRECYVLSGIPSEKVHVIPNGVNLNRFSPGNTRYPLKTKKKFKFLFVGGTIHRKGIDLVLDAYCKVFSRNDNVCLVIKGQPGGTYQGTELDEFLLDIRTRFPSAPDIEYITEPLTEDQVIALYRTCQVLVLPYRGEGFGLPIAEAMACGLPVIVTAEGAAADFVREEFAFLIPSQRRSTDVGSFKASAPGFWLEEPDVDSIVKAMRSAVTNSSRLTEMGRLARQYAEAHLDWNIAISQVMARLRELASRTPIRHQKRKIAFLCDVDWKKTEWLEILLAFASEFVPGDPVALAFVITEQNSGGMSTKQITELIAHALSDYDKVEYADLMLLQSISDTLEVFKNYEVQWVDKKSGSAIGMDGELGHRFARARLRASANVDQFL
jgi:glycosyltransferase involved in cell wall biosynthesis